jgi:P4 family phage/plasmid primase-like protien
MTRDTDGAERVCSILDLLACPAILLPIPPGQKKPADTGWQQYGPKQMEDPAYVRRFANGCNVGVLLGRPSHGLCTIDLDGDEYLEPFLAANTRLRGTLRTKRLRGANLWLKIQGDYPPLKPLHHRRLKNKKGKPLQIGEWRSTGGQTVIEGEVDGFAYQKLVEAEPITIPFSEIIWPEFVKDPPALEKPKGQQAALQSASLDIGRLENVQRLGDGSSRAACPACRDSGEDGTGDHLLIRADGRFGCCKYPGDHEHRQAIWSLAGTGVAVLSETEFDYANRLAETLPPLKTCGKDWFGYHAGAWHKIDRATLRPAAQNILPVSIRTARREGTLLDHLEGRFQTRSDVFKGFYSLTPQADILLNVQNGVVRVSGAGELALEPHSPDHLFTQRLCANYNPKAQAPLYSRVLNEVLSDPADQALFQLCAGNFLLPDCRFETALVCYGEAGRGKSTAAEPIAEALGRAVVPRLTMSQICDPKSYHVPKLRFAAVNLGTELDAVELGDSATFKAIVSGEAIEARPIYGEPFTMQTSCKLWFLANCLPRFKHGTEAELRRTRFLRFDFLPPQKDVTLKAKLALERDGVFLWMLAGLVELLSLPYIPIGGRYSKQVHDRFRISNDPVGAFVSTCCRLAPDAQVLKDTLAEAYKEFCERHDLPSGIGGWFFKSLYERWTQLHEVRPWQEGKRPRLIAGIDLKP